VERAHHGAGAGNPYKRARKTGRRGCHKPTEDDDFAMFGGTTAVTAKRDQEEDFLEKGVERELSGTRVWLCLPKR